MGLFSVNTLFLAGNKVKIKAKKVKKCKKTEG